MQNQQIKLANINEELSRLWNEEQGENKIRASLFNLILYIQQSERTEFYNELVKSVISKFPCRVIMIFANGNHNEEYLRTYVSSESLSAGEQQIYCEIIRIEVAGKLMERVPFIILPHILADLRVYLLWTLDPAINNPILSHLEPIADRIIFDSESTHDLQSYSKSVLALVRCFHCQIGDLNWSAISAWRNIFSQIFETMESLQLLTQSRIIRIHYNKNPHPGSFHQHTEIEAGYIQAWIASCMHWNFQSIEISEENIRVVYQGPTNDVVFLLIPELVSDLNPGTILSLEVESHINKSGYILKRHPQTQQVFIQYSDKDRCDLPYFTSLKGIPEGQEIIEEIFYPSTGKHYIDTLETLSKIPWKR